MKTRRSFFAALLAPFVARFAPKPASLPLSVPLHLEVADFNSRFIAPRGP